MHLQEVQLNNITALTDYITWCCDILFLSAQTFVLHRMVKGANATILLTCTISLVLSSLIAYVGCRSLPSCGCYDARTGLVGKNTVTTNSFEKDEINVIGLAVSRWCDKHCCFTARRF